MTSRGSGLELLQKAKQHADEAQASLELIGEGDFTPQDAHCGLLIIDVRALLAEVERLQRIEEAAERHVDEVQLAEATGGGDPFHTIDGLRSALGAVEQTGEAQ